MTSIADRAAAKIIKWIDQLAPAAGAYVLPALVKAHRLQALSITLAEFSIESVVVHGRQGIFEGSSNDLDVILKYAKTGEWSPIMIERIVTQFSDRAGTYIDIGANIGLTAIPVAARGFAVIAIEPVPQNLAYLRRNVALNSVEHRVSIHGCAILDVDRVVQFELSPRNHGDHRVRTDVAPALMGEEGWRTVSVEGLMLDAVVGDVASPVVIKLDTQGAEPWVISGGAKMFAQAEMVLCEFSPYQMKRMGTSAEVILTMLAAFDRIEIFDCESEIAEPQLPVSEAIEFLANYNQRYGDEPWGKYLNILAIRAPLG